MELAYRNSNGWLCERLGTCLFIHHRRNHCRACRRLSYDTIQRKTIRKGRIRSRFTVLLFGYVSFLGIIDSVGKSRNVHSSSRMDPFSENPVKPKISDRPRGFALVATILLMVLLAIITIGTLNLSVVTLRNSFQDSAHAQAQANARMALMIAIGELQKHAGSDTRITAPSGIVDESSAPLTGVWKSWEGSDHESAGLPIEPEYASKLTSKSEGGRFLSWLVSGAPNGGDPSNPSELAFSESTADTVPLLSVGTLGENPVGAVHVVPQLARDSGRFAWWVSGENQKARLPMPYKPENENSLAQWSDIASSHAVPDPKPFELETLLIDPTPAAKAVTLGTVDLIAGEGVTTTPRESFHHLSVSSVGLLTNTATGGWRKDLSLVTENWDALPATDLPFFRLDANYTTNSAKPTTALPQAQESIFYPWSAYLSAPTGAPIYQHGAVSTWHNLKDYATAYRRITAAGSVHSINFTAPNNIANAAESFTYLHTIRTTPVIARCHWLFSHRTTLIEGDPSTADDDTYTLQLLITPVVTMWNPYNVSIASPANLRISVGKPMPCVFRHYDKDGTALPQYRRVTQGRDVLSPGEIPGNHPVMPPGANSLSYLIPTAYTLAPGETRVFSPTTLVGIGAGNLNISPGLRLNTGHTVNVSSYAGPLNPDSKVKVDVRFDARFKEAAAASEIVGVWLDIFRGTSGLNYLQVHRLHYPPAMANTHWPPIPLNIGEVGADGNSPLWW